MNGIEQLPQPSMMLLAQFLTQIQSAKRSGKEAVTLQLEEVSLNPEGACIAIIQRYGDPNMYGNVVIFVNVLPNLQK